MSPRTRPARARTALLAAGMAGVVSLFAAAPSQAAFTVNPCEGSPILGAGASTQNAPQDSLWRTIALPSYCTPFGTTPTVQTYADGTATGSGYGRRILGERTGDNADGSKSRNPTRGERFGGTDEPPNTQQANQINQGTDASGDEATVRVIPVSVVAITALVNTPDGCDLFNGGSDVGAGAGSLTAAQLYSDANNADRERIRLPKNVLESIYAGLDEFDTWGEVFGNNVVATGANPTTQQCKDTPIKRVVRLDSSGSTFALKDYLGKIAPGRGWGALSNTAWPNEAHQANGVTTLVRAAANGGGGLRDTVNTTDGSIGYADLSAARGGTGQPFLRATTGADDKYWAQVQNGDGDFVDPQQQSTGWLAGATAATDKGARCSAVTFTNIPAGADPTFQSDGWFNVSGTNTTADGAYGICTLTYDLVFDDYSDAYGDSAAEQGKARTVKDYMRAIMSTAGQNGNGAGTGTGLWGQDQSPLPAELRDVALDGIDAMDWCKGGCGDTNTDPPGGGGTTNQPPAGGGQTQTPAPTPQQQAPAPVVTIPSNLFTLTSSRKSGNTLLLSYSLPAVGRLSVTAAGTYKEKVKKKGSKKTSTRTRRVTIGSQNLAVTRSGTLAVKLALSSAAKSALKKTKSISVVVKTTFTPTGGTARTVNKTVTLRGTGK